MLLCIETTTNVCSAALSKDGQIVALREIHEAGAHSSQLTLLIAALMTETGTDMAQLSAVAVSSGPGSYTGLRIGLSTAKGLCFALDLPLIAVPTLESLAGASRAAFPGAENLHWPMLDARRMEVYQALFDAEGRELSAMAPLVLAAGCMDAWLGDDKTLLLSGDGAEKALPLFPPERFRGTGILCSAAHLVFLAEKKFCEKRFENLAHFVPEYLKPPNINLPSA